MNRQLQPLSAEVQAVPGVSQLQVPVIDASQLLGESGELAILHGGETYKLTRTKQNKLLLTKCHGVVVHEEKQALKP